MNNARLDSVARLNDFRKQVHFLIATGEIEAPIIDSHGSRPIITVDEREFVSEVMTRAERTQGFANLFVLMDDDTLSSASIIPSTSALNAEEAPSLDEPIHTDAEIGLLIGAAGHSRHGLNFDVALPSHKGSFRDAQSGNFATA